MSMERPPGGVLRAFGVGPSVRRLEGGRGHSWLAGDLVLKPGGDAEARWRGESLGRLALDGVRLGSSVSTAEGNWSMDGWVATRFVAGTTPDLSLPSTWAGAIEAGRILHRALAPLRRPGFLDSRDDPWARADRVAWGEQPSHFVPELADLAVRLRSQPDPAGRSQLMHGDLTGNVLFLAGSPPAVIDVSPYWRPPSYAAGIVAADALCWHGADATVLALPGVRVADVARGLLFRMATTNELLASASFAVDLPDEARRYERAARAVGL